MLFGSVGNQNVVVIQLIIQFNYKIQSDDLFRVVFVGLTNIETGGLDRVSRICLRAHCANDSI